MYVAPWFLDGDTTTYIFHTDLECIFDDIAMIACKIPAQHWK